jgi:hypothetical protein
MEVIKDTEIKQEVVAAYTEVLRKLKIVKGTTKTEEDVHEEEIREEENNLIELAANETSDDLVKNISDLKLQICKTLDEIKNRLLPEYEKFATLRQAIELSKRQLKDTHDIEANAHSLGILLLAQKEKAAAFNQEIMEYRIGFENEKKTNDRERRNEENEYLLKRESTRKKDQEQYKNRYQELEDELMNRRQVFEEECEAREIRLVTREKEHQQLKEREAWITAREQEYQQLKESAAQFPEELRNKVLEAESKITERLTKKIEYDLRLLRIESESKEKLYQQKINALEEQIEQYKSLKQLYGG